MDTSSFQIKSYLICKDMDVRKLYIYTRHEWGAWTKAGSFIRYYY